MLNQLTIQNFGLIDRLSIDFFNQLNILTGETGAGKSIIIDALRYVLGERLESSLVRDPKQPCLVQAVFDLSACQLATDPLFADYIQPGESDLIIERSYQPDGRAKIKINGLAATLSQLKNIGNHLIDFHGAHDHQMLLQESQHILMLDKLISWENLKDAYSETYALYKNLLAQSEELSALARTTERDTDLLKHQIKELEEVSLNDEDLTKTEQEFIKIHNAQKLYGCAKQILEIFENDESSIENLLRQAFSPLKTLNQVDSSTERLLAGFSSIQENTQDFVHQLRSYVESLTYDDRLAQSVSAQYDAYQDIKRKYGPSIDDARAFYLQAKNKYDLLANYAHNDAELKNKIEEQKVLLQKIALKITKKRQAAARDIKTVIEQELKELGILHVQFETKIEKQDFSKDGQDSVIFYISPNAGEILKPLAQIVSSGEAARVMLALKKALIHVDAVPVLIFDEIDAQIGGRLGTITGKKLKELACNRQVILITHLPQIASFADNHFKISKTVVNGRAQTEITHLNKEGRIKEIAEMMSGQSQSEISISHAKAMLKHG